MRPAGTEIDGFQQRLASIVNGVAMAPPGRRALGGEGGHGGGGREEHVDLAEQLWRRRG